MPLLEQLAVKGHGDVLKRVLVGILVIFLFDSVALVPLVVAPMIVVLRVAVSRSTVAVILL